MDSVAELLRQFAFLGTVLAGFALTFLASLFNAPEKRRSVDCTVVAALIAAVCLIVCAVSSVSGVIYIVDRPGVRAMATMGELPPSVRDAVMGATRWARIGFISGMSAFLVSLGFSGWIRSRKLGMFSSALAAATLLLLLYFLGFVVKLLQRSP